MTPEQIAKGLSEPQKALVVASERGGFNRDDEACGVEISGPQCRTARSLERLGIGEYTFGDCFSDLYFNNQMGLAVRDVLRGV